MGLLLGFIIAREQMNNLESEMERLRKTMPPLRFFADACGVMVGTMVSRSDLNDIHFVKILTREFNFITSASYYFALIHPSRDQYAFKDADFVLSFAEAHEMRVRGHTLIWHNVLPSWIKEGNFTREEWIEILHDHIFTVVSRYRGRIYAWDVLNEAVDDDGSLRDTIWLRNIGPEYIDLAFRWAHEADPQALLFYNDYGAEGLGRKSDAVYNLVKGLLERGVPIHGVGLQMHVSLEYSPKPEEVAANIKRLGNLGLEVHITEMDVRIKLPVSKEKLSEQARIYGEIFKVYLDAENCTAFVMWGFTDRYSWIPSFFSGYGAALIFDGSYRPKQAYYALWRALVNKLAEEK